MPSVSEKQHRAMEAAAHGHSTLGIPEKVGKEFVSADEEVSLAPMLEEKTRDGELLMPLRDDSEDSPRTELDAARAIAEGQLSSPQKYGNVWLFDVRITGTDTAYRESLNEYVYRPPEHYLNDEFLARCNGLPVVVDHPDGKALDTEEFRTRVIGTIFVPYIKGDEVWGIAKIFDETGAELMLSTHGSTSPAVVFQRSDGNQTIEMDDGKHLLIEGIPSLLDHLAICKEGVWDKGQAPSGVNKGDSEMPETDKEVLKKGFEETSEGKEDRKDEGGMPAWADALMKKVDSLHEKHDAVSKRLDSIESEKKEDRKDESGEKKEHEEEGKDIKKLEEAHEKEGEDEKKYHKDEKKDSRKDFDAERDDARMDSVSRELSEFREWKKSVSRPLSHAEKDELAAIQSRFDSLAARFGETIQPPLLGETPTSYHRRLISRFQKHSERCKNVKLDALDSQSFPIIADQIYADAQSAASSESMNPVGGLRSETFTDFAGRKCTRYFGDIKTAFAPWVQKTLKVKLNTSLTSKK